ncbi:hypothetical protein IACHDJAJ_00036 [Aeromonas phage vB_AdhS_TS3]|nr:hypothetical protein IACHDJAJ_00036 [Aeromonas phage vB_AdhS_TS3]
MYSIPAKTAFICSIMNNFGYSPTSVIRASTVDDVVLWLDGLSGYTNGHDFISFTDAQRITKSVVRQFKESYEFMGTVVVGKKVPRVTSDFITRVIKEACEDSNVAVLRGKEFKGLVYSHRKGIVTDQATRQVARIIKRFDA